MLGIKFAKECACNLKQPTWTGTGGLTCVARYYSTLVIFGFLILAAGAYFA